MYSSFRLKLMAILVIATLSFWTLIVVGAQLEARADDQLTRIARHYVPRMEVGPRLNALFESLVHALSDAVAAKDPEALDASSSLRDELIVELDAAQDILGRDSSVAVRAACRTYFSTALATSRRLITEEMGRVSPAVVGEMQAKQRRASDLLHRATAFDQNALTDALREAAELQQTAARIRLIVSCSCLVLVLGFCLWLSRNVLRSLHALGDGFSHFGKGNFEARVQVASQDEFSVLAQQANQMAASLKAMLAQREHAVWLSSGVTGLLHEMHGDLEPDVVAQRVASRLSHYIGAPAALLYWFNSRSELELLGVHGGSPAPSRITQAHGLLLRSASSSQLTVVEHLPDDYLPLRSGLGAARPCMLVLVPLVRVERVVGVMELALFSAFTDAQRELLLALRESIAIGIEVACARATMRRLLDETQKQAGQLSEQEDELRANHSQLQARQEELLEAHNALQQQATELQTHRRSLEDNNAELQRTRQILERKAQALTSVSAYKSQFLANMSHELRTPLNSMLILSSLLSEHQAGPLTDKQTEYCRTIHGAATDLLALINQVLDLSKVEAGKQEVTAQEVPVEQLAIYAARIFEPLAREKGLEFAVDLDERVPPTIVTDRRKVEQILNNLLGNSIKFTAAGRVSLRIEPSESSAEQGRPKQGIVLLVSDTGSGIAPENRERIFAPFEQLDGSSDRKYGGSGLGLSIARELARLLKGELRLLTSSPGNGSVFTCWLPCTLLEEVRRPLARASHPSLCAAMDGPGYGRVLVVEDDRLVADMLVQLLREYGFEVVLARDAISAAGQLADEAFTCVVLDLGLPDIDGLDLLESMHRRYVESLPPILVYSGRSLSHAQFAWLEAHAEVVVLKEGLAIERLVDDVRLLSARFRDGARQRPSSVTIVPAARVSLLGRKIVVADDDMRNVYALCALLRPKGADLLIAENGREVLRLLDEHSDTELVLMDMVMPELDGYETTRALRRDPRFMALPIIAITARAMTDDRERSLLAGATDYLAKPVEAELLFATIGALISKPMMYGRGAIAS